MTHKTDDPYWIVNGVSLAVAHKASARISRTHIDVRHAIVILAGSFDALERFIDFLAGFFVLTFLDLFGKLVELLD